MREMFCKKYLGKICQESVFHNRKMTKSDVIKREFKLIYVGVKERK